MTLKELQFLESVLLNYKHSNSCADQMAQEEVDKALIIVRREIGNES